MLLFLVGSPGHSQTLLQSAQHLARHMVRLLLVFLGLASPVTPPSSLPHFAPFRPMTPAARIAKAVPESPNSMRLNTHVAMRRYTYRFEGQASYHGVPCPKASVLIRVISGHQTFARGGITRQDGTYTIEFPVLAADGAPVDWHMEAFSPEFKKLELSGRRIVQEEEDYSEATPIVVTTPVEFVVSRSK